MNQVMTEDHGAERPFPAHRLTRFRADDASNLSGDAVMGGVGRAVNQKGPIDVAAAGKLAARERACHDNAGVLGVEGP